MELCKYYYAGRCIMYLYFNEWRCQVGRLQLLEKGNRHTAIYALCMELKTALFHTRTCTRKIVDVNRISKERKNEKSTLIN